MSKRDKLRQRIKKNPQGVKYTELETLLTRFGFKLHRISGSHHIFQYNDGKHTFSVVVPAHGSSVKIPYVKDAIELLDELFPLLLADDETDEDE